MQRLYSLGFPVGALVRTPAGRVVAADAFGPRLADFDPGRLGSERFLALEGAFGLHGLAISGDEQELLIVHMAQDAASSINRTNIDWGLVISSKLSALRLTEFGAGVRKPNVGRLKLDGSGHGTADPTALAVTPDGSRVLIASAGANLVLAIDRTLGRPDTPGLLSLGDVDKIADREVGRNPRALVLDPSGGRVITADAMADTLTVLRVDRLEPAATIVLGPSPAEPTEVQRGEAWFRDGRAGHDRWMSCASCHDDGHTNNRNFDTNGDNSYGVAKNVPSLLGGGQTAPYAWNGRFARLEEQVHESLETSLRGPGAQPDQVELIAAFLRTLEPAPPRRSADDPVARRGAEVFRARGCDACHIPPLYTRPVLKDVGLDDGPGGNRRFNPPSLRGVARSAPYLHDGRARTLREALDLHHPGTDAPWLPGEADDLAAFLESL